jgi:hypothetical protein
VRRSGDRRRWATADLEGLGIPVFDLSYGRHITEIMGELIELLDTMGEADGQLF